MLSLIVGVLTVGCAQKATKVYTSEDINTVILSKALERPLTVTEKTVILDARPPFEFAMAHLPQAVNVQWMDLSDARGPFPGKMKEDTSAATRKLALLGITPNTPVIVLGQGLKGRGEEARLAWSLLYLGLFDVQTAEADALGLRYSNLEPPPRENAPAWDAEPRRSLVATREELLKVAKSPQTEKVHILDVRSKNEYFSKNRQLKYEVPDLRAIHIEWTEFFTPQGRPKMAIRGQLEAINVHTRDRILVISNTGLRSGAVTYALLALGYKNAANFAGGYPELLSSRGR